MSNHTLSSTATQTSSIQPLSIKTILLPVVVWIALLALVYAVLYMGSFRAVGDNIHAVALDGGQYIHGKDLDCSFGPGGRERTCTITLDGQPLIIKAQALGGPPPPVISGCTASFAGQQIECTQHYVTSSYWPFGVKIGDDAVAAAAVADADRLRTWRTTLLGWDEYPLIQVTLAAVVVATLLAVFVVPSVVGARGNSAETTIPAFKPVFYGLAVILLCAAVVLAATMGRGASIVLLQRFGMLAIIVFGLFVLVRAGAPAGPIKKQASGWFFRALTAVAMFVIGGYVLMGNLIWLEYID